MLRSQAEVATSWQGITEKNNDFPGHDVYENGVLERSSDRLYVAGWSNNWASNPFASGYFTDQPTIDNCIHDGRLNTNELDASIQTRLSDYNTPGLRNAHSCVSAYDVDYERLDHLKNGTESERALHSQLTNPDGLSPDGKDIKVAFGKAEANPHHGQGGGNQYYMNPDTFKDGIDSGVFNYNEGESFSTDGSTGKGIDRTTLSEAEYDSFCGGTYEGARNKAETVDDKRTKSMELERYATGKTEAQQINGQRVRVDSDMPYMASPDPSYYNSHEQNIDEANDYSKNNPDQTANGDVGQTRQKVPGDEDSEHGSGENDEPLSQAEEERDTDETIDTVDGDKDSDDVSLGEESEHEQFDSEVDIEPQEDMDETSDYDNDYEISDTDDIESGYEDDVSIDSEHDRDSENEMPTTSVEDNQDDGGSEDENQEDIDEEAGTSDESNIEEADEIDNGEQAHVDEQGPVDMGEPKYIDGSTYDDDIAGNMGSDELHMNRSVNETDVPSDISSQEEEMPTSSEDIDSVNGQQVTDEEMPTINDSQEFEGGSYEGSQEEEMPSSSQDIDSDNGEQVSDEEMPTVDESRGYEDSSDEGTQEDGMPTTLNEEEHANAESGTDTAESEEEEDSIESTENDVKAEGTYQDGESNDDDEMPTTRDEYEEDSETESTSDEATSDEEVSDAPAENDAPDMAEDQEMEM